MKFQSFLNNTKIINELNNLKDISFIMDDYHKELFKINIGEKSGVQNIEKKVLDVAIKFLMKKFDLNNDELEYIGYTDLSFIKKDSKLLQFNILKKGHPKHGSTVAYKYER